MRGSPLRILLSMLVAVAMMSCLTMPAWAGAHCAGMAGSTPSVAANGAATADGADGPMDDCPRRASIACALPCLALEVTALLSSAPTDTAETPRSTLKVLALDGRERAPSTPPPRQRSV